MDGTRWWLPTRKWYALLVSGLATIGASWLVTGAFDDVERGMLGTLVTTLAATWATPNSSDPDREVVKQRMERRRVP